jgi:hypothetical protein
VAPSNSGCTWSATSNVAWITNVTASGTGNGTVNYTVAANPGIARTGIITVNGQTHTVNQENGCTYQIAPLSSPTIPSAGSNSNTVTVTASDGTCGWTSTVASANTQWISITAGANGSGNGQVTYNVLSNNGNARTGTITIAGKTHTVNQASGCGYTLIPNQASVPKEGVSNATFNVSPSNSNCTWTAMTTDNWIMINNGSSGTGNGTVTYTVNPNVSPGRTGKITVNGQDFIITQANGCTYSLSR